MSELDFTTLKLPFEKGDWVDADTRMFHACFIILGEYVEKELGTEPASWSADREDGENGMYRGYRLHASDDGDKKAIDLWLWYRDELPALKEDYAKDVRESFSGKIMTVPETVAGVEIKRVISLGRVKESKYEYGHVENVCDQKLKKLMEIRESLWT
jgi:hypothetical protein